MKKYKLTTYSLQDVYNPASTRQTPAHSQWLTQAATTTGSSNIETQAEEDTSPEQPRTRFDIEKLKNLEIANIF